MRAINHALTGAVIGFAVGEPLLALPFALGSHFVCDAIPHSDFDKPSQTWMGTASFKYSLYADGLLCVLLVLLICILQPAGWLLAVTSAFLATSPDLISIRRYRAVLSNKPFEPTAYEKFATKIQWFQRPIGMVVEIVWFFAAAYLLFQFL